MTTEPRDPDIDMILFGVAYGQFQEDGSIVWLDPASIIIRRPTEQMHDYYH